MTDSVTEAARQWLTRFMDLYAGMDTGGSGDPCDTRGGEQAA